MTSLLLVRSVLNLDRVGKRCKASIKNDICVELASLANSTGGRCTCATGGLGLGRLILLIKAET